MGLNAFDQLAEARIQEALEAGELSNLPGEGKPLTFSDDPLVPAELRVAYRMLKNAGMLPPEVQLRKDIAAAEDLLMQARDSQNGDDYSRALRRLQLLRQRLGKTRKSGQTNFRLEAEYYDKLLARLACKE